MATTKVTLTLDDEQLEEVRALVSAGTAPSVSGFVEHAVGRSWLRAMSRVSGDSTRI